MLFDNGWYSVVVVGTSSYDTRDRRDKVVDCCRYHFLWLYWLGSSLTVGITSRTLWLVGMTQSRLTAVSTTEVTRGDRVIDCCQYHFPWLYWLGSTLTVGTTSWTLWLGGAQSRWLLLWQERRYIIVTFYIRIKTNIKTAAGVLLYFIRMFSQTWAYP